MSSRPSREAKAVRGASQTAIDRFRRSIAASPRIEPLDRRVLLTSSYVADPSVALVTLKHHPTSSYDVDVYLGADTTPTAFLTPDSNNKIFITGQHSNFKLVDTMPAAVKPIGGVDLHLTGTGNTNGILEVDDRSNDDDKLYALSASATGNNTITTNDGTHTGTDHAGMNVSALVIRTNEFDASNLSEGSTVNVENGLAVGVSLTIDTGAGKYDTINIAANDEQTISSDLFVITAPSTIP